MKRLIFSLLVLVVIMAGSFITVANAAVIKPFADCQFGFFSDDPNDAEPEFYHFGCFSDDPNDAEPEFYQISCFSEDPNDADEPE